LWFQFFWHHATYPDADAYPHANADAYTYTDANANA